MQDAPSNQPEVSEDSMKKCIFFYSNLEPSRSGSESEPKSQQYQTWTAVDPVQRTGFFDPVVGPKDRGQNNQNW